MFLRTLLLFFGSIAMVVFGYFGFDQVWPAAIVAIGLPLGWLLRRQIVDHFELLSWALPAAVITYGIVMFVGERILGMPRELQLAVITTVTVVLFGIQFWSLSDPSIVKGGHV
jgi:hypothetical protein